MTATGFLWLATIVWVEFGLVFLVDWLIKRQ